MIDNDLHFAHELKNQGDGEGGGAGGGVVGGHGEEADAAAGWLADRVVSGPKGAVNVAA